MRRLPCSCGHAPAAHEHFRPTEHCGLCPCRQYRVSLRRRARALVGR